MTITVGTDSYATIGQADAYHVEMGNDAWSSESQSNKESALKKATNWLEGRFRGRWKGFVADFEQALAWPRVGVVDEEGRLADGIPLRVVHACCLLAFKSLSEDLLPDVEAGAPVKKKKLGPLEKEYFDTTQPFKCFAEIERLIEGLVITKSSNVPIVRR